MARPHFACWRFLFVFPSWEIDFPDGKAGTKRQRLPRVQTQRSALRATGGENADALAAPGRIGQHAVDLLGATSILGAGYDDGSLQRVEINWAQVRRVQGLFPHLFGLV